MVETSLPFTRHDFERLARDLALVFADVPQPGDDDIATHECDECLGVRDSFRGVRWQDAPRALVIENHDKLPLLTPSAHQYYLPAYLLLALANVEESMFPTAAEPLPVLDSVTEFVIYDIQCAHRLGEPINEWRLERMARFTTAQIGVLMRFLEFLEELEPEAATIGLRCWREELARRT